MNNVLIYPAGGTDACRYAALFLRQSKRPIVDHPTPEVTHLLLDVPSFRSDGLLRSGEAVDKILERLPQEVTVVGGNLNHPALAEHKTVDLLKDSRFLAVNAAITADCALQVAAPLLTTTVQDSPALVIGWGRIGKCLARLLKAVGNDVTVAARKEADRAVLSALGYNSLDTAKLASTLSRYRLIFNTVPEVVLSCSHTELCKNSVKIDLASKRGIEGDDVVLARGLPGIHAPETSGKLIAETFIRLFEEE